MIVFGGLGVFIQIYKIMIPQLFKMQGQMVNSLSQLDTYDQSNPFRNNANVFNQIMGISDTQANVLFIAGLLGLAACAFYIIGGAKLLKAVPANYHFAKYSLIGFLVLNIITTTLLTTSGPSFIIMGVLVYVILGIVTDLVLLIILLASDKTKYGIGARESDEIDTVYRPEDVV